jgi:hypothetical protein
MASYIASSAIRHRVIDGNVVILDLRSGEYKILDEVATMMWRAALEGVDRPACVESIAEKFAAAPAEVATDSWPTPKQPGCSRRGRTPRALRPC